MEFLPGGEDVLLILGQLPPQIIDHSSTHSCIERGKITLDAVKDGISPWKTRMSSFSSVNFRHRL
jgi:hypothetical protein